MGQRSNLRVGETGVGEMGVGETGQIIGETGVGEMGVNRTICVAKIHSIIQPNISSFID